MIARSADWAQVRPEWGLAGCRTFVVAPRERTRHLDLAGRSFLHSYDWRADAGFGVLELVMTAPMVVASWISLQYYASTVDNDRFGSGNKVLHNVTGRTGVFEGNGGDLRVGLPWQSVHDGEHYQHEPLRLNVVIEAPIDAMNDVIARHAGVADLLDNGWLHLFAMDDSGAISHHYEGAPALGVGRGSGYGAGVTTERGVRCARHDPGGSLPARTQLVVGERASRRGPGERLRHGDDQVAR